MAPVAVREIACKSALSKSGLADYALNCYLGCSHGCRYCYARFMKRFTDHAEPWGEFVDAKVNIVTVLARQVRRLSPGRVFVSSVCDGWQPLEEKYLLTRHCLELLVSTGYEISVLTKSSLVRRDFDLLCREGVEVGVTVTTVDESVRRVVEPAASPTAERLDALAEAGAKGARIYAFAGPFLPGLTDGEEQLAALLRAIADAAPERVLVDALNVRPGVWASLQEMLRRDFPSLLGPYGKLLFAPALRRAYLRGLRKRVMRAARGCGLEERLVFLF